MKKFFKNYLIYIMAILVLLVFITTSIFLYYHHLYKIDKDFSKIDLTNINKLMIVAHPDDELLWGGAHLIKDDYLVVCITCGTRKDRVKEFVNVMNETHDKYIMLGYPDKTNGARDNWDTVRADIIKDITAILALKDWELIVTHNPDGEYGHIHHQMTSSITTDLVSNKEILHYFGIYHSKKNLPKYIEEMVPIDDALLKEKKRIIGLYITQAFIQTSFDHMNAYEEWLTFDEWSELHEETN